MGRPPPRLTITRQLATMAILSSFMTFLVMTTTETLRAMHAPHEDSHISGAAAAPASWNGTYFEPQLRPWPNLCNKARGWGTCNATGPPRCVCAVGHGGADCAFSVNALYGDLLDYKAFAASKHLRPLDLQGWSPGAAVYRKYMALADIEAGTWKGTSASHLAQWLKDQGRGLLITVDTWLGSAENWEKKNDNKSLNRLFGYPTMSSHDAPAQLC